MMIPTRIFRKIIYVDLQTAMNNAIAANLIALELLSDPFLKILQFMSSKTTNQSDITIGVISKLESGLKK